MAKSRIRSETYYNENAARQVHLASVTARVGFCVKSTGPTGNNWIRALPIFETEILKKMMNCSSKCFNKTEFLFLQWLVINGPARRAGRTWVTCLQWNLHFRWPLSLCYQSCLIKVSCQSIIQSVWRTGKLFINRSIEHSFSLSASKKQVRESVNQHTKTIQKKKKKNNNNKGKQKLELFYSPTVRHMVLREAVKGFYKI